MEGLTRFFSEDHLTVEEFEERVDDCYRMRSVDELETLFADLPAVPDLREPVGGEAGGEPHDSRRAGRGELERHGPAGSPASDRPAHGLVLGLMGGTRRSGSWTPPRRTHALAVMGGAELDFRQARFPPGVTTVTAVAVMGGIDIVVPPGLRVECSGIPLLGGFDRLDQDGDPGAFPGAVLRIRGVACMGGIDVSVRAADAER